MAPNQGVDRPAAGALRPPRVALAVGGTLLGLVGAVAVLAQGPVAFVSAPTSPGHGSPGSPIDLPTPSGLAVGAGAAAQQPEWLAIVVQAFGVVLALFSAWLLWLALARLMARMRRSRWLRRGRPLHPNGPVALLPEVPEVPAHLVGAAAARRRARLVDGPPRNAIVACWIDLEAGVTAAGLPQRHSETSAEYAARVLGRWWVDHVALAELAELYREARFSTHPLDAGHRERAIRALDRLHADLAAAAAATIDETRSAAGRSASTEAFR